MMDYLGDDNDHSDSETKVMNYKGLEYTFTWLIENYSYCLKKNGKALESPMFIVNGLEGIAWHIQLYPRGNFIMCPGHISVFLKRSEREIGPEIIPVKFELSLLAVDGSEVLLDQLKKKFKTGEAHGYAGLLNISDLLLRRKDELLPQDTLSVRCKMWIYNPKIQKIGQSLARTRIRVKHLYFMQVVEGFSSLKPKEKKTFFLNVREERTMKVRLQLSDSSDGTISLKITSPSDKKILSICKLFIVGASGILTKCVEGDIRADATRKDISKLPLYLTKMDILEKKDEYLPDDKLTLLFQCSFSTGVIRYEKIEKTVYDIPSSVLNQMNNQLTEKPSTCSSVDDLITF